ncbi:MAG: NUDIX hydrolase [Candidatus Rokubacteria bacterium]|nr:NUDIX hydrolase [Candidatus Rokubacteria bacterium]MBI3825330.1 NUDIX hydrolase [Candidatus Rokubacteria bacterium]
MPPASDPGSPVRREYPHVPRVGVGAVVLHEGRVLLVRRGGQPSMGKWTLPGGLVELGETTAEAARREIAEECGLDIRLGGVAGVVDRVVRDAEGHVRYHYVLVDYVAYADTDRVTAGSDAAEARWADVGEIDGLDVTEGLLDMIRRALALGGEDAR